MSDEEILEILVAAQYIMAEDREEALEESNNDPHQAIRYLLKEDVITEGIMGQAIAEYMEVPFYDLGTMSPSKEEVYKIPEDIARELRIVVFQETDDVVKVATDSPAVLTGKAQISIQKEEKGGFLGGKKAVTEEKNITVELERMLGKQVSYGYALSKHIDQTFTLYKASLSKRFKNIFNNLDQVAPEIVEELITEAVYQGVSDIHFEPQEKGEDVRVRFRIDGMLQEIIQLPFNYYQNVLNYVKIESLMRTDEHFAPQDGAIRMEIKGEKNDVRVSVLPTVLGEKIVMRILTNASTSSITLESLGFNQENLRLVRKAAKQPFGMIIVTGPTGSGKSTTLFALLKSVNEPDINISTIEDPVEYKIPGVNHAQVNAQAGLTFAGGLRSLLRQDPDTILVGEIRDSETAQISVNAALTGHLLFSTLHANDAPGTLPRLLNMDVDPFLVASTLELIIAQRLARKICSSCVYTYTTTISELEEQYDEKLGRFFNQEKLTLYRGKGCSKCNYSGYKGRVGVFQLISMTEQLRELIMKHPTGDEIRRLSRKQGSKSMFEDGIEKAKMGQTTVEEVMRVAAVPEEDDQQQEADKPITP